MARLQRKKTSGAKKRKKKKLNVVDGTSVGIKGNVAAKKTGIFSGSTGRQKQSSTSQKALAVKKEPGKIKGYLDKGLQFLREVKVELKKVVWPTRKQTMGSTVVVLILVMLISLFLGVVDFGLSGLVRLVLH